MTMETSIKEIEKGILYFNQQEQQILLSKLLSLLKISLEDLYLLKAAETSFDFWNNPEDSIYDSL